MKCIVIKFPKNLVMEDGDELRLIYPVNNDQIMAKATIRRKGARRFKKVDFKVSTKEY